MSKLPSQRQKLTLLLTQSSKEKKTKTHKDTKQSQYCRISYIGPNFQLISNKSFGLCTFRYQPINYPPPHPPRIHNIGCTFNSLVQQVYTYRSRAGKTAFRAQLQPQLYATLAIGVQMWLKIWPHATKSVDTSFLHHSEDMEVPHLESYSSYLKTISCVSSLEAIFIIQEWKFSEKWMHALIWIWFRG